VSTQGLVGLGLLRGILPFGLTILLINVIDRLISQWVCRMGFVFLLPRLANMNPFDRDTA
jgi:hypothetical protein